MIALRSSFLSRFAALLFFVVCPTVVLAQLGVPLRPIITELQGEGLSLAKIATELNKRKVPTPRGGKWDHSSVRNVLKRLAA